MSQPETAPTVSRLFTGTTYSAATPAFTPTPTAKPADSDDFVEVKTASSRHHGAGTSHGSGQARQGGNRSGGAPRQASGRSGARGTHAPGGREGGKANQAAAVQTPLAPPQAAAGSATSSEKRSYAGALRAAPSAAP